jgi:hypothetical protein
LSGLLALVHGIVITNSKRQFPKFRSLDVNSKWRKAITNLAGVEHPFFLQFPGELVMRLALASNGLSKTPTCLPKQHRMTTALYMVSLPHVARFTPLAEVVGYFGDFINRFKLCLRERMNGNGHGWLLLSQGR